MPRNQKNSKGPTMADVRQDVTDRIQNALKQGVVPWHKPWRAGDALPMNVREAFREDQSKRKPYRGINVLLLSLESMMKGYSSPYWLTYNAAEKMAYRNWCQQHGKKIGWADAEATKINRNAPSFKEFKAARGGGVREGEKSTRIYLFRAIPIEDKDTGETKHIPYAKSFAVFNVEQCDNLCLPTVETETVPFNPCDEAERILRDYDERDAPPVAWGGHHAYYHPVEDRIQVPEREVYDTPADYYFTLFHEHAHGTGAATRLNRPGIVKESAQRGRDDYSQEELVAEFTAAFLGAHCGLDADRRIENSAAYIKHWSEFLKSDPNAIAKAVGEAQKAADYILDVQYDPDNNDNDPVAAINLAA